MHHYRAQLDLPHPVIAENGAVIDVPRDYFDDSIVSSSEGHARERIQAAYSAAKREHEYDCEAFFELNVSGIMRETGLDRVAAERANLRGASEPVLWRDSDARAAQFAAQMSEHGLFCVRGGRFLHVMTSPGKHTAVAKLLERYTVRWPSAKITSVSLGDGPNDLGMLATTDIAVVIPGRHEHPMPLSSNLRVLHPKAAGPAGWNEAILSILAEYNEQASSKARSGG